MAILRQLQAAPFDIVVCIGCSGPLQRELEQMDIETRLLEFHNDQGQRYPRQVLRDQLLRVCQQIRPQLIHANSLAMSSLVGPVAVRASIPSLGHLRDMLRISSQASRDLQCHARLLAVSAATKAWYEHWGVAPEKLHVVHNGVDLDRFRPRERTGYLHRELSLPPSAVLLATVGQIGLRKGTQDVLEAFRQVIAKQSNVHLLIVGERHSRKLESIEFEQSLRRRAGSSELAEHVHFLGYRNDIAHLLPELTALVHGARQEPLGRVLLEAAAVALPIVATDVGGTGEIFPPRTNSAVLVPAQKPDKMAHEVHRILQDTARQAELGRSARQRIKSNFSDKACAARMREHYEAAKDCPGH